MFETYEERVARQDRIKLVSRSMFYEFADVHLKGAAMLWSEQSKKNQEVWIDKATRHVREEKHKGEQFDWRTNPYAR